MKRNYFVMLLCIGMLLLASCGKSNKPQAEEPTVDGSQSEDEHVMRAMYLTYGEDSHVFIEQENETVFQATFPEEIYNISGEKISKDHLVRGNIVEITGNGIMAESYPGQYHGISKMEVVEEGSPADADQYQYIIDQIYQEPDLSMPPELSISYATDIAGVSIAASTGGYEWTYTDENGEQQSVIADGSHILEWDEIIDVMIMEPTEMTMHFSQEPVLVTVEKWTAAAMNSDAVESETLESEAVESVQVEEGWTITAEPGYVYLIKANWDNGYREFGFYTPAE